MENEEIEKALLDAFPTYDSLQRMLKHRLKENLEAIAGREGNLQEVVFKLIYHWALPQNKLAQLIAGALKEVPGNELLQQVEQDLRQSTSSPGFTLKEPMPISGNEPVGSQSLPGEFFLCYSSEDNENAERIRTSLEDQGYSIWRDQESLRAGAHFSLEIEQAIRRAAAVIALVSRMSSESVWVRNELQFALNYDKVIIPVVIEENAKPPLEIFSLQRVNLVNNWEKGMQKLVNRLSESAQDKKSMQRSTPLPPVEQPIPRQGQNPFLYGNLIPAELFFGRKEALNAICNRLGNYYALQSLSIVSNRRMGKSSLLNYIWKKTDVVFPADHSYRAVYIDVMDARALSIIGFMRLLRQSIEKQTNQMLWDEKYDGELPALTDSLEKWGEDNGTRLVLLLDEWEGVMAYKELDPLLKTLRSCGSRSWIGMITATVHSLPKLEQSGKLVSGFSNIFIEHYLGNFPRSEWEELVRQAFMRSRCRCDENTLDQIGELSGGHPYLVQLAGSLFWQASFSRKDASQVSAEFQLQARPIFAALFQQLPPEGLQAVRQFALGRVSQNISASTLDDLRLRGVIVGNRLFCESFQQYVLETVRSQ